MSQPIVQVRNLRRRFKEVEAVRGISFDIEPGQVVGFIGANGAGKTTTMRMMATLEVQNSGTITVGGYDTLNEPYEVRRIIGWMPDAYGTYENVLVEEYLDFYARAFGFRGAERIRRIGEVMEFTNLTSIADRPMNKLSKGMAQRLCLGRTLLHDPQLLILDEPAAGLDPQARIEFKHLVRILADEGKTLFISSHILSELAEMCDTLLFIEGGRLIHHGSSESLLNTQSAEGSLVEIRLAGEIGATAARLLEWLPLQPCVEVQEATRTGAKVRLAPDTPEAHAALLGNLVREGFPVAEFRKQERKLEDAFVEVLGRERAGK